VLLELWVVLGIRDLSGFSGLSATRVIEKPGIFFTNGKKVRYSI
jgi:hypothetical protein